MSAARPLGYRGLSIDRAAGVVGVLLLGWLLYDTGFVTVGQCLSRMGSGAILAVVPYTIASLCDAAGWRAVLRSISGTRVSFARLWLVRLAGEAVNSVAPTGIGGEPLKVHLLRRVGVRGSEGAAAVVVSRTAVTVTQSLLVVAGVTALLARLGWGWEVPVMSLLLLAGAGAFGYVLLQLQRRGPLAVCARAIRHFLPNGGLADRLQNKAGAIDARLSDFYHHQGALLVRTGCWHFFGWMASVGEIWFVLRLLGTPISASEALIIEAIAQPIRATALVVPGAVGTQEAGGVAVCCWLGIPRDVSVALWLVRRVRELLFDGIGLSYLTMTGALGRFGTLAGRETAPPSPS